MENKHRTALRSFEEGQGKDKHFQGQKQIIFAAFYKLFPCVNRIVEPSKPKGNDNDND